MKKKLLSFLCLLTLLFIMGCNKEKENPAPTPTTVPTETATPTPTSTPTPTPTPVPENLAMTNLEKLPASFDEFMANQPQNAVDYTNGLGYDIKMDVTINEDLMEALGVTGLESIGLNGSMDIKDALAMNAGLYLNQTEVISADLFADLEHVMFNLPKYSSSYATVTVEELLGISTEELTAAFNTEGLPTNAELTELLQNAVTDFVACFQPQEGIEKNISIGTGEYVVNGDLHTVVADTKDLEAYLAGIKAALEAYPAFTFEEEELTFGDANSFIINYYDGADDSYAWEFYPDTKADEAIIFVSTAKGLCLYSLEAGTPEVMLYSVAASDTTGTITIPGDEGEDSDFTVNYTTGDNAFSITMAEDDVELTMNFKSQNNILTYDFTLVAEGMSIVMEETATATQVDLKLTLASYGMKLGSLSMSTTLRDYAAPVTPQTTTDIETWTNGLDQNALTADLIKLMNDFPFLMELILGSGEEENENTTPKSSYTPDANYSDAFMNMTGYYIDADGYVDFEPEEDEIMALGAPSTGYDSLAITEEQKTSLLDYAEAAFTSSNRYNDKFYWVWGSTKYNDVKSYYSVEYRYTDTNSWDNSITLDFDAVSGEFIAATVCNASKDEAFRMANELLKLLNIDYEITQEAAESYTCTNGLAISGYDAAEYGGNYYSVGFEVYEQ